MTVLVECQVLRTSRVCVESETVACVTVSHDRL